MSNDDYHTGAKGTPIARLIEFHKEYIQFSNIEKQHEHLMVRYEQIVHVEHITSYAGMGNINIYIKNPKFLKDRTNPFTIQEYIHINFRGGECSLGKITGAIGNWCQACRGYIYNIDTHKEGMRVI